MQSTIDINGRQVPFRLEDNTGQFTGVPVADIGSLVAEALVSALHFPLATTVRAVVLTAARTAAEISIELTDQRVRKQIHLRGITARRFSDYLRALDNDQAWDPHVKRLLRESLMQGLEFEFRRLSQPQV